jgi:hypothetical protein
MRGIRLSTKVKGYGGTDLIETLAARIKFLGWHLQLHFNRAGEIAELEARLLEAAGASRVRSPRAGARRRGTASPGFEALARVLEQRDDCWVKISSFYKLSQSGPPSYADLKARGAGADRAASGPRRVGKQLAAPNEFGPGHGRMTAT